MANNSKCIKSLSLEKILQSSLISVDKIYIFGSTNQSAIQNMSADSVLRMFFQHIVLADGKHLNTKYLFLENVQGINDCFVVEKVMFL
jgi:hypothetical protein